MSSPIARRVRESIPAGMNQQMLAAQVSMTPDAFSRALNGKRHFSALELGDLARALDLDLNWLITGERDPFEISLAARHRWDGGQQHSAQTDMDFIAMVRKVYHSAYDPTGLGTALAVLPRDPRAARALLPAGKIATLGERIQAGLGIDVIRDPKLHTDYSLHIGPRPVILLKSTSQWFRANWSLAHELGHIALGHRTDRPDVTTERPADQFAAEFLLPAASLQEADWAGMDERELAVFIWESGVSTEALRRRLATLKISPSVAVERALHEPTQRLLRRHVDAFAEEEFVDPIWQRENRTTGRQFPADVISRLAAQVQQGHADPFLLAWARDVSVSELEEEWPLDEPLPTPEDIDVDAWFSLVEER